MIRVKFPETEIENAGARCGVLDLRNGLNYISTTTAQVLSLYSFTKKQRKTQAKKQSIRCKLPLQICMTNFRANEEAVDLLQTRAVVADSCKFARCSFQREINIGHMAVLGPFVSSKQCCS